MSGLMESAWADDTASGTDTVGQSGMQSVAESGKSIHD